MKRKEAPSTASTEEPRLGEFYCGCAGFNNINWVGNFYPRTLVGSDSERQLNHYQQHFNSVEINGTFYGLPTDATIAKWKRLAAKGFSIVLKGKKTITHDGPTLNVDELEIFLERAMLLGSNLLAAILLQCPQTLVVDVSQLEDVRSAVLRTGYNGRIAFEFRNATTYKSAQVRSFLKNNNWALVYHPNSVGRSTIGTTSSGRGNAALIEYKTEDLGSMTNACEPTADFVYVRMHGTNDEHYGEYETAQLDAIAHQVHLWREKGLRVFCFFLNDKEPTSSKGTTYEYWSAMPKNCQQLNERVYRLANETPPRAPKQPKTTLKSFFNKK